MSVVIVRFGQTRIICFIANDAGELSIGQARGYIKFLQRALYAMREVVEGRKMFFFSSFGRKMIIFFETSVTSFPRARAAY